MRRAAAWLGASYVVHTVGLLVFWWTWNASFGLEGRSISPALDVPLAYAELLVTGVIAAALAVQSARTKGSWLVIPQTLSLFLSATWIWAVVVIHGIA